MNWSRGYTSSVYVRTVDAETWRDDETINIYGGSISRAGGDLAESATIECVDYDQTAERWIRIYLDTKQGGDSAHNALFTGLATSPSRDINGRLFTNSVECYSVLKPADDVLLPRGWYAPAGASGAALVEQLLAVTPAPKVRADASPILTAAYIAEDGESHLTMARKILDAINWRLRIEGDGTISIEPKPIETVATFDCLEYDSIEPKLSVGYDWFSCPNVFRAVQGDVSAVAVDDDENSIFSTVTRGREIWKEESNVKLTGTESLQAYAKRRLKEEQMVALSATYDRRYHPDINVGDLIRLHYPEQRIDGVFRVISQDIDLEHGGRTSEEAEIYAV